MQGTLELGYRGKTTSSFDSAGISAHNSGARGAVDYTAPLFDQPVGYTRVDAFARWRATPTLLVTLRGYNLGDERYAEIGGYAMPGRSFALELSTH